MVHGLESQAGLTSHGSGSVGAELSAEQLRALGFDPAGVPALRDAIARGLAAKLAHHDLDELVVWITPEQPRVVTRAILAEHLRSNDLRELARDVLAQKVPTRSVLSFTSGEGIAEIAYMQLPPLKEPTGRHARRARRAVARRGATP